MINLFNENRESNFLIICDHASKFIPTEYKNLGLDESVLDTHIAYDIGAKEVAIRASNLLQCPLVMSDFSRLLIDPNRGVDDPTLIMKISDGSIIQGNKKISYLSDCEDKVNRIRSFYDVYYYKILELIKKSIAGIKDSPPSKENLFCPTYFFCKKFSKVCALFRLSRICSFSSFEKLG